MINLLPTDVKLDRKYARGNRKLAMWLLVCVVGIAALFAIAGGGFLLLQQSISNEENANIDLTAKLEEQQVDTQIAEFKSFSSELSTVTNILEERYLFSTLVRRIGGTIPPDAVLTGVGLTGEDLTLTLNFTATSNETANQILVNLNDPENGLFDQADTLFITCSLDDPDNPVAFPCRTDIKVLFDAESDFVLLNSLLSEQAVADATGNALNSVDAAGEYYGEEARLKGTKDSYTVSVLSNNRQAQSSVANDIAVTYSFVDTIDNEKVDNQSAYFKKTSTVSHVCPEGGITINIDPETQKTFLCRTIIDITFAQNPSLAEKERAERQNDAPASLRDDFISEYRTNL